MPSKKFSKMENLPKNVAEEWAKWCRNPNYLFEIPKEKLTIKKITLDVSGLMADVKRENNVYEAK